MPFTFDPIRHIYTLDGRPLISVTQVLEYSGLVDYSFLPPSTRNMALARGSAVHLATALDDEGDLDYDALDPVLPGYVDGWREFRGDTGFVPDLIEQRAYHPKHLYAGTRDRRGKFPTSKFRRTLDIKCGNAEPWVWIQIAAYMAFDEDPRATLPYVVELPGNGKWREYPRPADWSFDLYFNYFLSCLTVTRLQILCGARKAA
jgi:hypothetical protein